MISNIEAVWTPSHPMRLAWLDRCWSPLDVPVEVIELFERGDGFDSASVAGRAFSLRLLGLDEADSITAHFRAYLQSNDWQGELDLDPGADPRYRAHDVIVLSGDAGSDYVGVFAKTGHCMALLHDDMNEPRIRSSIDELLEAAVKHATQPDSLPYIQYLASAGRD